MIKGDKVVREGLLEEVTFVRGPVEGRPRREARPVEGRAGAEGEREHSQLSRVSRETLKRQQTQ